MDIRYLLPTPAAALDCLSAPPEQDETRLLAHLLRAGRALSLDMPALAGALQMSAGAVARAMFSLNRRQAITVLEQEPPARERWAQGGLAGLTHDLVALAVPGQKILLASTDGLSIARVGWSPYEADVMAARPPRSLASAQWTVWTLHAGARRFVLSANARLDQGNPVWRQFAYRLLQGCRTPQEDMPAC